MDIELPKGPYFCDVETPEGRVPNLRLVFKDIEKSTQGVFTKKDIASSQKVLDLGMGRGSVGAVIKEINPKCQLTGVDSEKYQGANCYPLYNQRFCGDDGDLTKEKVWNKLKNNADFDLIISVGLPSQVITHLIKDIDRLKELMSQKGVLILISDASYKYDLLSIWYRPLTLFKGSLVIDNSILIYRKLNPDIIPLSQMEDILRIEHGVIFFPKRDFQIPEITDESLRKLVGDTNFGDAQRIISTLSRFLNNSRAVGDRWGKNHNARREWRRAMAAKYGQSFIDVYYTNNQFRANSLFISHVLMFDLSEYLKERHTDLANKLSMIYREMFAKQNAVNYNEIEFLDDKLEIVRFYEDNILKALQLLTIGLLQ
jgi:hypothetical protein